MESLEIIGLICGCCALFFAIVTGLTYFRIKKLISLISEDLLEQALPIIEKQRRRVYAYIILSSIFTVATVVLSIIV
ncbi:hypothetical protein [Ruminococcus sp.]|uniref:hypothetical protein n=1 Tax=Ruminococcus sp. TaxID=41978 RepID=UPI00386ED15F